MKQSLLFLFLLVSSIVFAQKPHVTPKLILQITVDQLRGDLIEKYKEHMGQSGFNYLTSNGTWYKNAYYKYAITHTAVGHTTLATGAYPSEHGIVANNWFDRQNNKAVYCVEDNSSYILSFSTRDTPKNFTQGRSAKNIMVSTFSDELSLSNNKKSKIFSVSIKDRGAITLAGHAGKAFWFDKKSGDFITSSYYYKKYPSWVKKYHKNKKNNNWSNKSWKTMLNPNQYIYKDDKKGEVSHRNFATTFPHPYGLSSDKNFNTRLTLSPVGDELTLDFVKALMKSEHLGEHTQTDFLAISFSSTDYVGHLFSPSSMEAQDNLLRLDKTLTELFHFIDKNVGLKNTLIVLSADHGAPESPSHFHNFSMQSQDLYLDALQKQSEYIQNYAQPYVYLNHALIQKRGLLLADVQKDVAQKLMHIYGISKAIISTDILTNKLNNTLLNEATIKSFYASRSGDILLITQPHFILNSKKWKMACNHGSPWRYDTYVPIIFVGDTIKAQNIYREVEPNSIAPTLSAIMNIKIPSAATTSLLKEVISNLK